MLKTPHVCACLDFKVVPMFLNTYCKNMEADAFVVHPAPHKGLAVKDWIKFHLKTKLVFLPFSFSFMFFPKGVTVVAWNSYKVFGQKNIGEEVARRVS